MVPLALPRPAAWLFMLFLFGSPLGMAQTSDVQVRAVVTNDNTFATPTRFIRIRTEATNLGPDGLASLSVQLSTTTASANSLDVSVLGPCVAVEGPGTVVNLTWAAGPLPTGTTAACEIELRARSTAQPAIFIFRAEAIVSGFVDPDLGNGRPLIDLLSVSPIDIFQDMVLTIRSPAGLLPAQPASATADLMLTNRGPDSFPPNWIHLLRSEVYRTSGAGAESFVIGSAGDPDCQLFADDVGNNRILQINYLDPIPPGTSQTCTLRVAARQGATGARSLRWDVGRLTPGLLETNLADNTAFLVMQFSPAIIPVDARWALLLLICALGALGAWRLRHATW